MYKFSVGERVRYIGQANSWSPPSGTIGTVLRIKPNPTLYMVKFDIDCPAQIEFSRNINFYFAEDELEKIDKDDNGWRLKIKISQLIPRRACYG